MATMFPFEPVSLPKYAETLLVVVKLYSVDIDVELLPMLFVAPVEKHSVLAPAAFLIYKTRRPDAEVIGKFTVAFKKYFPGLTMFILLFAAS